MAYKVRIILEPCAKCPRIAEITVYTWNNIKVGDYCIRHADKIVKDTDLAEDMGLM